VHRRVILQSLAGGAVIQLNMKDPPSISSSRVSASVISAMRAPENGANQLANLINGSTFRDLSGSAGARHR
jgi:hypothetical protein